MNVSKVKHSENTYEYLDDKTESWYKRWFTIENSRSDLKLRFELF